jgi:hypothetical protein
MKIGELREDRRLRLQELVEAGRFDWYDKLDGRAARRQREKQQATKTQKILERHVVQLGGGDSSAIDDTSLPESNYGALSTLSAAAAAAAKNAPSIPGAQTYAQRAARNFLFSHSTQETGIGSATTSILDTTNASISPSQANRQPVPVRFQTNNNAIKNPSTGQQRILGSNRVHAIGISTQTSAPIVPAPVGAAAAAAYQPASSQGQHFHNSFLQSNALLDAAVLHGGGPQHQSADNLFLSHHANAITAADTVGHHMQQHDPYMFTSNSSLEHTVSIQHTSPSFPPHPATAAAGIVANGVGSGGLGQHNPFLQPTPANTASLPVDHILGGGGHGQQHNPYMALSGALDNLGQQGQFSNNNLLDMPSGGLLNLSLQQQSFNNMAAGISSSSSSPPAYAGAAPPPQHSAAANPYITAETHAQTAPTIQPPLFPQAQQLLQLLQAASIPTNTTTSDPSAVATSALNTALSAVLVNALLPGLLSSVGNENLLFSLLQALALIRGGGGLFGGLQPLSLSASSMPSSTSSQSLPSSSSTSVNMSTATGTSSGGPAGPAASLLNSMFQLPAASTSGGGVVAAAANAPSLVGSGGSIANTNHGTPPPTDGYVPNHQQNLGNNNGFVSSSLPPSSLATASFSAPPCSKPPPLVSSTSGNGVVNKNNGWTAGAGIGMSSSDSCPSSSSSGGTMTASLTSQSISAANAVAQAMIGLLSEEEEEDDDEVEEENEEAAEEGEEEEDIDSNNDNDDDDGEDEEDDGDENTEGNESPSQSPL